MAEIYSFVFTKADVTKEKETFKGFTRESVEEKMKEDGIEALAIHETDDVIVVVVQEKPEEEETTRLGMITPTLFAILQDKKEVFGQISEVFKKDLVEGKVDNMDIKGNIVELHKNPGYKNVNSSSVIVVEDEKNEK